MDLPYFCDTDLYFIRLILKLWEYIYTPMFVHPPQLLQLCIKFYLLIPAFQFGIIQFSIFDFLQKQLLETNLIEFSESAGNR